MSSTSVRILAIYSSTLSLAATYLTGTLTGMPFGTCARRAVAAAVVGWVAGGVLGKVWFRLTDISDEEQRTSSGEVSLGGSGNIDEHTPDQP